MSDAVYPDGEFAKLANTIALDILRQEGNPITRENYLEAIRQVVLSLRGHSV